MIGEVTSFRILCADEGEGAYLCRVEYRNLITDAWGKTEDSAIRKALKRMAKAIRKNYL